LIFNYLFQAKKKIQYRRWFFRLQQPYFYHILQSFVGFCRMNSLDQFIENRLQRSLNSADKGITESIDAFLGGLKSLGRIEIQRGFSPFLQNNFTSLS
jgi:hypothetical protein